MTDHAWTMALEHSPDPETVEAISQGLKSFNLLHAPDDGYNPVTITLRDGEGSVIGGLLGETYWGWLHVDVLWISDEGQLKGSGSQMLHMAEQEAVARGCRHAHLDTMSFQALPFYQKHGYAVFGVLEDLPEGHSRYFLKKDLT